MKWVISKRLWLGLGRELRPWQWYKQVIVLLGILFSGNLFNAQAGIRVAVTVVAFCAVSGAVYIFNDINDVEEDRRHPEKQNRPIASGQVPIRVGAVFGVIILLGGLVLSWTVNVVTMGVVVAYLFNNVLYNAFLKERLFVDVFTIAVGFVLRALAGVYAIQPSLRIPSSWLIVCTFLTALMLGFGKRYQELKIAEDGETRTSLEEYSLEVLDRLLIIVIATLLMAYSLYTFSGTTRIMMLTLPFAYFATFRFYHLLFVESDGNSIEKVLLHDRPFLLNLILWVMAILIVIYARNPLMGGL